MLAARDLGAELMVYPAAFNTVRAADGVRGRVAVGKPARCPKRSTAPWRC